MIEFCSMHLFSQYISRREFSPPTLSGEVLTKMHYLTEKSLPFLFLKEKYPPHAIISLSLLRYNLLLCLFFWYQHPFTFSRLH